MGSDISAAPREACTCGIHTPRSLLLPRVLEPGRQPTLNVIGIYPAHISKQTAADYIAGKPAAPMSEIGMGNSKRDRTLANGGNEGFGFLEVHAKRFLAKY